MNEPNRTYPTTEQLATLAATLARNSTNTAPDLAAAALEVWTASANALATARYEQAHPVEREAALALPKPKRYPATRDEFARLMLPHLKGRTGALARALKDFARFELERHKPFRHDTPPEPATPEEVSEYFANWPPIANADDFQCAAEPFLRWWKRHHATEVSEARRKAAALGQKRRKAGAKAKRRARPPLKRLQAALKEAGP